MGWTEVVDSAVKIGLGAIVGGAFSLGVARLAHRHELSKLSIQRRWDLLQQVQLEITTFAAAVSEFWANLRNAVYLRDKGTSLTDSEQRELEELERKVFSGFSSIATPSSKLLLLGEKEANTALGEFRNACDSLFRIASLTNSNCTAVALDAKKEAIISTRNATYDAISRAYIRA